MNRYKNDSDKNELVYDIIYLYDRLMSSKRKECKKELKVPC